jgi:thymidylate synthase
MNIADKQYLELIQDILENGKEKKNRTGTNSVSVFGRELRFDLSTGLFPLLTTKKVFFKGVIHELMWFLNNIPEPYRKIGNTNIKYLIDNDVKIWNHWAYEHYKKSYYFSSNPVSYKGGIVTNVHSDFDEFVEKMKTNNWFASSNGHCGPIYGEQWSKKCKWTENSQIENLIELLRKDPDSRRMILSSWNVDELHQMALEPCHYSFQLYSEEQKGKNKRRLSLLWNQRSSDVPLGLPFNIASYALLLKMFCKVVDMEPYEIICNIGDAHIYLNQIDGIKEQLKRNPDKYSSPKVNFKKENYKEISEIMYDDVTLKEYESYPKIQMPIAI